MEEKRKRNIFIELIKDLAIAFIIAGLIYLVMVPTIVKESSMEPNFYEDDYLLISKLSYKLGEPKRDDVVVFHSALKTDGGAEKLLIKRVIGLPGDLITIDEGRVYINGKEEDQSFTKDGITTGSLHDYKVPEGHVFCMGDNRVVSLDSRYEEVGPVPIDEIIGKVFFRLYPFDKIGTASLK